jgi:hypothetical protein
MWRQSYGLSRRRHPCLTFNTLLSQPFVLFFLVPRNFGILLYGLGHQLSKVLFLAFGNGFRFHLDDKRSAQVFDHALNRFDCLLQSIYRGELVGGISAQHIQWWGDELRFDWDGVVALLLPGPESLFDGVNAGRCVACKLDIRPKFDRLWCQATGDRGGEDG